MELITAVFIEKKPILKKQKTFKSKPSRFTRYIIKTKHNHRTIM